MDRTSATPRKADRSLDRSLVDAGTSHELCLPSERETVPGIYVNLHMGLPDGWTIE